MGLRVGEGAEVSPNHLCAVDSRKERSLSRSALREPVNPKCSVDWPDDVVGGVVGGEGELPPLVVGESAKGGIFAFGKRIRVRRRADADPVQKKKKDVLHLRERCQPGKVTVEEGKCHGQNTRRR
jgi:hypothetical protein